MPFVVLKSDNRRETFDRNKLREGIARACEKRSISAEQVEKSVIRLKDLARRLKDLAEENEATREARHDVPGACSAAIRSNTRLISCSSSSYVAR